RRPPGREGPEHDLPLRGLPRSGGASGARPGAALHPVARHGEGLVCLADPGHQLHDDLPVRRRLDEVMAASITVAVGAIVTDGEHILLIRRGHNPGKGYWSIPGGRVETGETLPAAVRREIREECSLDVAVGDVAILLDRVTRGDDGAVLSHYL